MKNLNRNPIAWFIFTILLGYILTGQGDLNSFVVLVSATIIAKLVEIINKLERD